MSNVVCRVTALLIGVVFCVATATPAEAAASWSLTTTGAAGWGSYARAHQTYTITYTLYDTKTDGDCAYLALRPEVQWATKVPGWVSVGTWGYEKRHRICGWGKHIKGTDRIDVWAHMSVLDRQLATRMRMRVKVCRDTSFSRDNCSEIVTAAVNL